MCWMMKSLVLFIKWVWLALSLSLKHRVQRPPRRKRTPIQWLRFKFNKTILTRKLLSLAMRADHYCHSLKQVSCLIKQVLPVDTSCFMWTHTVYESDECGEILNCSTIQSGAQRLYPEGLTGGTSCFSIRTESQYYNIQNTTSWRLHWNAKGQAQVKTLQDFTVINTVNLFYDFFFFKRVNLFYTFLLSLVTVNCSSGSFEIVNS